MSKTILISVGVAVVATVGGNLPDARAQAAPTFEYGKAESVQPVQDEDGKPLTGPVWLVTAQGGLVLSSGNSRQTTFNAGASASRKAGNNKLALDAAAAYTRARLQIATDANGNGLIGEDEIDVINQTTTKSWSVKGRYDRFLSERNSLYLASSIAADEPAGKELLAGAQAGYSRLLFKSAVHELALEVGGDFSHEDYVAPGAALDIFSARAFAGYIATVSSGTSVSASLELLTNLADEEPSTGTVAAFDDNRLNAKSALTTKVTDDISFRFGLTSKYDAAPAPRAPFPGTMGFEPGTDALADKLDLVIEAQLIVGII